MGGAYKNGWFLNSYDVIRDNIMGVVLLNAIEEIYSSVWKGMKENQECTNGDYYLEMQD